MFYCILSAWVENFFLDMHTLSFSGKKIRLGLKCCHELHSRPSTGIGSTNLVPIDLARISQVFVLFSVSKAVKTEDHSKDTPHQMIQLTLSITRFLSGCLRASLVRWEPQWFVSLLCLL